MGMVFIRAFTVFLLAVSVIGCAKEPPKCNDPKTVSLVQKIFLNQLLPAEYKSIAAELFNSKTKIELAAPTKYDKDIKKLECSGIFVIDASAGVDQRGRDTLTNPRLLRELGYSSQVKNVSSEINGGRFAFNMSYYSQDVDGQHMVAIQGVDSFRAFLVGAYVAGHIQQPARHEQTSTEEQHDEITAKNEIEEIIVSSEAPKCSASEVVALLKETFAKQVIGAAEKQLQMRQSLPIATTAEKFQEKKQELLAALGVHEILSDGYDAEARKRICRTYIFANAAPNYKIPARYVIQLPEESSKLSVTPVFDMPDGLEGFNLLIGLRGLLVEAMGADPKETPKEESSAPNV